MKKNKRAQNDVTVIFGVALFMLISTLFIYYITTEFNETSINPNFDADHDSTGVSSLDLIFRLLFWRYPYLPFWLDAVWKVLELVIVFIIYRALRSGAG